MKKRFRFYLFLVLALVWGVLFYLGIVFGSRWVNEIYIKYKYPLRYSEQITQYSEDFSLEPSLVSAVIYEESRFRVGSASGKGAVGLMQLLPDTADYIAGKIEGQRFDSRGLGDPEKNIKYGCFYLAYLNKKYSDLDKVLAAYNAGEGNVDQWIAEGDYEVKFEETSNFVERVKKTREVYKRLYFEK
jgi:soluble lytic murein transglycosylase